MRFVMILYRHGAVILLQLLAVTVVVKSHVCLLKKRPDPSRDGTLRWSLLYDEICYCEGVAAPRSQDTCPLQDQSCSDGYACKLWFDDDPTPLTQRQNWKKDTLDMFLKRTVYCKETTQLPTETIVTGKTDLEETTKAETEAASLSQKTDAVEASTSADQEKTTQAEAEGVSSSQKTDAVEASTSADQEETTQAETEQATFSQKTDAVEASTFADQEETTQAETEGASSSQNTDAVESSTSADQEETTQAEEEEASLSQKTDAIEASSSADQEKTTQAEGASQKIDAVETSTSVDQEVTTQAETEGESSSRRTDAVEASTSADQEETTQVETEGASSSQKTDAVESSTSADPEETKGEGSSQKTDVVETSTFADQACESWPLGMADGSILDENITASSYQEPREPKHARLGVNNYWFSDVDDSEPWIQVDLGSSHRVTGLQPEGNNNEWSPNWVEQLSVKVGMSEASLMFIIDDNGQPRVFDANTDPYNVADIILNESGIRTRFVRIYPTNCKNTWDRSDTCLMRFEIMGCMES